MTTILRTVALVDITCCNCGLLFAVPDWWKTRRREDGKSFYCPNGHQQCYTETEADRLRKQLEQVQAAADRARAYASHAEDQRAAADRSAAAFKGQVTKLRKRVGNGVCPCCSRSFVNVQRHMAAQHPEYADAEPTEGGAQ